MLLQIVSLSTIQSFFLFFFLLSLHRNWRMPFFACFFFFILSLFFFFFPREGCMKLWMKCTKLSSPYWKHIETSGSLPWHTASYRRPLTALLIRYLWGKAPLARHLARLQYLLMIDDSKMKTAEKQVSFLFLTEASVCFVLPIKHAL